jgi:hypothetical protein
MTEYGFMPALPCEECGGRWPTRYQYCVTAAGPDGTRAVLLCSECFAALFRNGVRRFNLKYTGHARRARLEGPEPRSPRST